jgi:drug/metabolite transporter (DMT)-like permease
MSPVRLPWQAKFGVLCLVWGASFLLMKIGLGALAPVQIATLRILSGTVTVLVAASVVRTRMPRSPRVWAHMTVVGLALGALPFTLFPLGEERVASALAGIGNATTPLAVVVFTLLLIPAQRVDRRTVLAVLTGFLGVVVIVQPWQAQGRPDLLGFGFTLLAGASYGFGWTYLRKFLHADDLGGLGLPAAQLVTASGWMVVVTGVWWWLQRSDGGTARALPWSTSPVPGTDGTASALGPVLAVLALGVVGTGLAFVLQFDVVRQVGATVGATVTYVIPVVAVVLGVVLLHERLSVYQVVGAAIVLTSAVVIGRPASRKPATDEVTDEVTDRVTGSEPVGERSGGASGSAPTPG